jgi:hypothetical protein
MILMSGLIYSNSSLKCSILKIMPNE